MKNDTPRWRWPNAADVDRAEQAAGVFTRGIGPYKLVYVLFVGSFFGVVVEMLWCLFESGTVAGRAGLVYGPFNLLYGIGAVVMTVVLHPFRHHRWWVHAFGGMLVGTAVEYVCSWWQEVTFGSRSWDYSGHLYNLNGRVCLLFTVLWGVLGLVWMKVLYPPLCLVLTRIPARAGKWLAWGLTLFLAANAIITMLAVARWSQRIDGDAPDSTFEALVDEHFPDERMEHIFNNMIFRP